MTEPAAHDAQRPVAPQRLAALVGAMLGVRTDHASARFDAEIAAALTAHRVDEQTARALRFWQRASVEAVEEYIGTVLPVAFAAHDDADRQGSVDTAEAAAAWQAAQATQPTQTTEPTQTTQPTHTAEPSQATQLTRRLISLRDGATRYRSAKETERAVRAALQFDSLQFAVQFEGKDSGHARSATSA